MLTCTAAYGGLIREFTVEQSLTDDDDVLKHIARAFAEAHPNGMALRCGHDYWQDGITNGADWYPIYGTGVSVLERTRACRQFTRL
jgi:hypothetical protein